MVELEAADALASAARFAAEDDRVQKVCIWTPDKDLAQCVRGERVVQVDRKTKGIRDAQGGGEESGVKSGATPNFSRTPCASRMPFVLRATCTTRSPRTHCARSVSGCQMHT